MELKTSPTGMGAIMSGVVPGSQLDRAGVVRPGHVLVSVAGAADVAPPPTSSGAHFGCSLWLCGCVAVCLGCLGVCVCAFLAIVLPCQARTSAEWCSMTSRHSSSACWHVPCAWGSPTLTPSLHILPRYVVTPCRSLRRLSCLVACWCNLRNGAASGSQCGRTGHQCHHTQPPPPGWRWAFPRALRPQYVAPWGTRAVLQLSHRCATRACSTTLLAFRADGLPVRVFARVLRCVCHGGCLTPVCVAAQLGETRRRE